MPSGPWEEGAEEKIPRASKSSLSPRLSVQIYLQRRARDKGMKSDYFDIGQDSRPPLNAPSRSQTKGGVNFLPGGVNYVGDGMENTKVEPAYTIAPRLQEITMDIPRTYATQSKETFFVDMFLMLANSDRRQITAREVAERHEEKLLMLGPVLERLESELLDPFDWPDFQCDATRRTHPSTATRVTRREPSKVEYISMLAQAQKMVGTTTVEQLSAYVGSLTAVVPEVIDKFNADKAVDRYADMLGG